NYPPTTYNYTSHNTLPQPAALPIFNFMGVVGARRPPTTIHFVPPCVGTSFHDCDSINTAVLPTCR
ncbi:MAG: hypothetical protein AAGD25_28645, partial [Cyanobacteria bacterium P01_F01_bin.150]